MKMGAAGVVAEPVGLTPGVDDRGVEEGGRMGYLMGVLLGLGVAVLELYMLLVVIHIGGGVMFMTYHLLQWVMVEVIMGRVTV